MVVAIVFHVIPTESTHVLSYCDNNITCVLLVSETRVISVLLIVIPKHLFFLHCSMIVFFYIPQFSFSHLAGALDTIVMKHTSKSSFCWNLKGLPHGIEVGLNV